MSWLTNILVAATVGTTPPAGALSPTITQATIGATICHRGYTATVRPSFTYTNDIKRRSLPPGHAMHEYELDHFIPLELGGSPDSLDNLWLQPWDGPCGAHAKDRDENRLRRDVCNGSKTLADAQAEMTRITRECKP